MCHYATGRTALNVADNPRLLSLLDNVLTEKGSRPSCHLLGRPALQALTQQRFGVLVTDVRLPAIDGLQLCAVAQEQYDDHTTILIISGVDIHYRTLVSLKFGADDVLPKPFDLAELLARIDAKARRLPAA